MKQSRWKCPTCGHGLLAPQRPRRDDVRRYCLPCSSKTGKLVERVAPALDAQRNARDMARREREKAQRARKRQANNTPRKVAQRHWSKVGEHGMLIKPETARLWNLLKKFPNELPQGSSTRYRANRMKPPTVELKEKYWHVDDEGHLFTRGASYAYISEHRIAVTPCTSWETLAHEIIHCAGYYNHDRNFYLALKWLTETRWKVRVDYSKVTRWGYDVDYIIIKQIKDVVKQHFDKPVETKVETPSS